MFRSLAILLLFASFLHASTTAAWKVPIESLAADYRTNNQIRKLEKAPAESAFFKPGDEFWVVSGFLRNRSLLPYGWMESSYEEEQKPPGPWQGKWAVWNARSGILVAQGAHADMLKAQLAWDFKEEPVRIRCRLDWMRPGAAEPFQTIEALSRSGEATESKKDGISIKAESSAGSEGGIFTRIAADWKTGEGESRWSVVTAVERSKEGKTLLAKHGTGDTAWELYLTAAVEKAEGDLPAGNRWLETEHGGLRSWPGSDASIPGHTRIRIDGNRELAWYPLPPEFTSLPLPLPKYDLQVPPDLAAWIDGPLVDSLKLLREQGIDVDAPGFFAGYHPLARQLLVAGSEASHLDIARLLEDLSGLPDPLYWIESDPESGNCGLIVRNMEKALITRSREGKEETVMQVEASRSPAGVGLQLDMDITGDSGKNGSLATHLDMVPGRWREVMEYSGEESTGISVRLTTLLP